MGDNRPSVYYEGHNLIIRASAIGHPCMWELIAAGQEIDSKGVPKNIKRAYQEGHDAEPLIIKELEERGWVITERQAQGDLVLSNHIRVRLHPDGIGDIPDLRDLVVVEIKNLSNDVWQRGARLGIENTFPEYPWQLSAMMIFYGMPGVWVARNKGFPPDKKTGIKPPCEDEGKLLIQHVKQPLVSREELRLKAILIKEGVDGEDLLTSERPCDAPGHFPCRYLHVRPEVEAEVGDARPDHLLVDGAGDDGDEVDQLIRDYLFHKGQADEAKKRQDAAKVLLIERLWGMAAEGADELKEVRTAKWKVNLAWAHSTKYHWDEMSPELKRVINQHKETKKTSQYISKVERLD